MDDSSSLRAPARSRPGRPLSLRADGGVLLLLATARSCRDRNRAKRRLPTTNNKKSPSKTLQQDPAHPGMPDKDKRLEEKAQELFGKSFKVSVGRLKQRTADVPSAAVGPRSSPCLTLPAKKQNQTKSLHRTSSPTSASSAASTSAGSSRGARWPSPKRRRRCRRSNSARRTLEEGGASF